MHRHECPICHSQFKSNPALWRHKKSKGGCLAYVFCKQDHEHSFVVKKYSNRDADEFFLQLGRFAVKFDA